MGEKVECVETGRIQGTILVLSFEPPEILQLRVKERSMTAKRNPGDSLLSSRDAH